MRRVLFLAVATAAAVLLGCGSAPKINDCGPGLRFCSGGCTSLVNDDANCGACGNACASDHYCYASSCIPSRIVVTSTSVTYSDDFAAKLSSPVQCAEFDAFRKLLTGSFTSVTFSGSKDPTGVTCNDPTMATQLANALAAAVSGTAHSGDTLVSCNGNPWQVCNRGDNIEFWVGSSVQCDGGNCPTAGHMMRPCFPSLGFWGGIPPTDSDPSSSTCQPPSQTMKVEFNR